VVAEEMIFHITERESWETAHGTGEYVAESLARQGFIHASAREQVVETANLHYARGRTRSSCCASMRRGWTRR